MRVVAGLAVFFLLSGTAAVAQYTPPRTTTLPDGFAVFCTGPASPVDGKQSKGSTLNSCSTPVAPSCPVDMRVRQRRGGAAVAVDANGVKRNVFAQRLRLILNDLRRDNAGRKAVSATVTVHGTGGKARMQYLASGTGNNSMAKTFNVDLAGADEPGVSGDFLLPGFTSASQVDLESVTYEDGSTWKLAKNESCRVAPDPLMLVTQ